jgi:hypothetical protein
LLSVIGAGGGLAESGRRSECRVGAKAGHADGMAGARRVESEASMGRISGKQGQRLVADRLRDRCPPGQHITEKLLVAKYGKRLSGLWQTFAIISKTPKNRNNGAWDDMVLVPVSMPPARIPDS